MQLPYKSVCSSRAVAFVTPFFVMLMIRDYCMYAVASASCAALGMSAAFISPLLSMHSLLPF
jgi:hypothetical protein